MSVSPYIAHSDMVEALVFSRDDPFVRHVIVEQGHRRVRIDSVTEFEPETGQKPGCSINSHCTSLGGAFHGPGIFP